MDGEIRDPGNDPDGPVKLAAVVVLSAAAVAACVVAALLWAAGS